MHLRIRLSSADLPMGIGFLDEIRIDLIRAESVFPGGPESSSAREWFLHCVGCVLAIAAWFPEGQHNDRNCQQCHGDRVDRCFCADPHGLADS